MGVAASTTDVRPTIPVRDRHGGLLLPIGEQGSIILSFRGTGGIESEVGVRCGEGEGRLGVVPVDVGVLGSGFGELSE